jgi:hypothetical protein
VYFASVTDLFGIPVAGGTVSPVFAGGISRSAIPAGLTAMARRWHGTIDERFGSIDNPVSRRRNEKSTGGDVS